MNQTDALLRMMGTVNVPAVNQSIRMNFYAICATIFRAHLHGVDSARIRSCTSSFVQSMEGEKDPRCLLLCFEIIAFLMKTFGDKIASISEDVFDVVACYFPITFSAADSDPYGITGQDLILKLRNVFSSHSSMAIHVIPFLLDKALTSSPGVQKDVMESLNQCLGAYVITEIHPYLPEISDLILRFCLESNDDEVCQASLRVLSVIAPRVLDFDRDWDNFGGFILNKCLEELTVLESRRSRVSLSMIENLASSSPSTCLRCFDQIKSSILTVFFEHMNSLSEAEVRINLEFLQSLFFKLDKFPAHSLDLFSTRFHSIFKSLSEILEVLEVQESLMVISILSSIARFVPSCSSSCFAVGIPILLNLSEHVQIDQVLDSFQRLLRRHPSTFAYLKDNLIDLIFSAIRSDPYSVPATSWYILSSLSSFDEQCFAYVFSSIADMIPLSRDSLRSKETLCSTLCMLIRNNDLPLDVIDSRAMSLIEAFALEERMESTEFVTLLLSRCSSVSQDVISRRFLRSSEGYSMEFLSALLIGMTSQSLAVCLDSRELLERLLNDTSEASVKALASVINKTSSEEIVSLCVRYFKNVHWLNVTEWKLFSRKLLYTVKALVDRSHRLFAEALEIATSALFILLTGKQTDKAIQVADAFGSVLIDDEVLTKAFFYRSSPLAKQRYILTLLSNIDRFKSEADVDSLVNKCLFAFISGVVLAAPGPILKDFSDKLVIICITALKLNRDTGSELEKSTAVTEKIVIKLSFFLIVLAPVLP